MRLLNTATLNSRYQVDNTASYVILSPTRGEEEVLLENTHQSPAPTLAGYGKLFRCCQQAKAEGLARLGLMPATIPREVALNCLIPVVLCSSDIGGSYLLCIFGAYRAAIAMLYVQKMSVQKCH